MEWLSSTQLKGDFVTLEPLNKTHVEGLKKAVLDLGSYGLLMFHLLKSWRNM